MGRRRVWSEGLAMCGKDRAGKTLTEGVSVPSNLRIGAVNRPGVLNAIGHELGAAGINIDGFCAVTTNGRGFVHLLVEDAAGARKALDRAGYAVDSTREAIVIDADVHQPGTLGDLAGKFTGHGVNVEVSYLATGNRVVFVVDDIDKARAALA